jgi:hypothetical protein
VNTDVAITNRKTFMPVATSEAVHAEVSTYKHLELVTAYDKISVRVIRYTTL